MWPLYKPRLPLVGTGAVSGRPHHRRPGGGMGPPGADEQDRGVSNASSVRRGRYRQAVRDAAFLLRLWPILLLAFLAVVPLIVLGVGTAVLGVGVPVLGLGLSVSSRFAEIGRRAVADVDSSEYVPGHYRRPGAGEQGARTLLAPLRGPQRWADLTWVVVGLVVPLATWAFALVWIAAPRQMPASRLERDIHDGPQQRLVRLGMDLARAKRQTSRDPRAAGGGGGRVAPERKTSRDPRAAETILDGSIAQTREALDELRGLSRGIAPPVLVDRGLVAALAEVAVRSGVPGAVDADVPRLSERVEQAAYFVASEALANLNKHSGARAAELVAVVEDGALRLWVVDDGVGGASVDDVIIADIRMPPSHTDEGLCAATRIRRQWASAPILLLSQYVVAGYLPELLVDGGGGIGYLLKDRVTDIDSFLSAVECVARGELVLDPDVVAQVMRRGRRNDPIETLTPREQAPSDGVL